MARPSHDRRRAGLCPLPNIHSSNPVRQPDLARTNYAAVLASSRKNYVAPIAMAISQSAFEMLIFR